MFLFRTVRYCLLQFWVRDPNQAYNKMSSSRLVDKAASIQSVLNYFYPNPPVPLNSVNNFTFLCAVILSAQTTDGKVNDATADLFKVASTPAQMAKLDPKEVERYVKSVGLAPQKAKNIVAMSQKLLDNFNGEVPNNFKDLESLNGVGHKTASVVMSHVFGEPSLAVDTHVHRLAVRWGISKETKNVLKVQKDLSDFFPREDWNKLHLQMIYFGREFCVAKEHQNSSCPICCWVHDADVMPPSAGRLKHEFIRRKPSKGIVFYDDRTLELNMQPALAYVSSPAKSTASSSPLPRPSSKRVGIKQRTVSSSRTMKSSKTSVCIDAEIKVVERKRITPEDDFLAKTIAASSKKRVRKK